MERFSLLSGKCIRRQAVLKLLFGYFAESHVFFLTVRGHWINAARNCNG